MEEAIFHGWWEVIERDAWSIAKFSGDAYDAVAIEDRPENKFLMDIVDHYGRAHIEIVAKDITSDIGIPVIAAFSQDWSMKPWSPSTVSALIWIRKWHGRALTEVATTRALFIQNYGSKGSGKSSLFMLQRWHRRGPPVLCPRGKNAPGYGGGFHEDLLKDIEQVITILKSHGYERLIVVDLTLPEIGIPTVRIIVPGMEAFCFDKREGSAVVSQSRLKGHNMLTKEEIRERAQYCYLVFLQLSRLRENMQVKPECYLDYLNNQHSA